MLGRLKRTLMSRWRIQFPGSCGKPSFFSGPWVLSSAFFRDTCGRLNWIKLGLVTRGRLKKGQITGAKRRGVKVGAQSQRLFSLDLNPSQRIFTGYISLQMSILGKLLNNISWDDSRPLMKNSSEFPERGKIFLKERFATPIQGKNPTQESASTIGKTNFMSRILKIIDRKSTVCRPLPTFFVSCFWLCSSLGWVSCSPWLTTVCRDFF